MLFATVNVYARGNNLLVFDIDKYFPFWCFNIQSCCLQVDRKLVKQTVMTSVYGVTYIGARDQIKRRLQERGLFDDNPELFSAACYAAKVIAVMNYFIDYIFSVTFLLYQ